MFEAFFLAALVILVVLAIRPGKTAVFDNPVVIHRPGQYHATLAPQLDRAQNFIEHIARQFTESGLHAGDIATQYFEVHAGGQYLLAVGFRSGMLYFQAIMPLSSGADSHYKTLHQFSGQVMVHLPLTTPLGEQDAVILRAAVESAARQLQISCLRLQE